MKYIIPALLLCAVFNACASDAENNITDDYVTDWNAVTEGQIAPTFPLGTDIINLCKTAAPEQFRREIIHQWEQKTGTHMTQNAFLSEDLQLFDRLATLSCLEGADYQHQGNGDLLIKSLNAQLRVLDAKDGNDAFEQIKTMEFQTGILTARYGTSLEKKRTHGGT
jgi:hypothetical protein